MRILKRSGIFEELRLDKITERIQSQINLLDLRDAKVLDAVKIAMKVCESIKDGITSSELDEITAQICMNYSLDHPDWADLGARIIVDNHRKNVRAKGVSNFCDAMKKLYEHEDIHGESAPLISDDLYEIIIEHWEEINSIIVPERDYLFDYFGFKTLERSYLMKTGTSVVETPQYMWMRVALGIWEDDFVRVKNTYDLMSKKYFTHATPTLFHSGTPHGQFVSCFLLGTEDSVDDIYKTITDCARISKWAGGIGVHISNVRSNGSYIRKTGGCTDGILPMLKVYNETARYINQGGGKRNGSFAMYLEPWHADIFAFLDAKSNHGNDLDRARDLFYALWVPDLFMKRVQEDGVWSLMCPDVCPGLNDKFGDDFEELYEEYELEGQFKEQISARKLWSKILVSQMETGMPYMCYKDHVNKKNNQSNRGIIRSSNLCVAPETRILTSNGYETISELKDQKVDVWNGNRWSETTVRQTGTNQELLKVKLSNGTSLYCTKYHKFYIESGCQPSQYSKPIIVEAQQLESGMKLIKHELPIINNEHAIDFPHAYTHGFFCSDGTYQYNRYGSHVKMPKIALYGEKKELITFLEVRSSSFKETANGTINILIPHTVPEKFLVPINGYSLRSKIEWLSGVLDGDGSVAINGTNESLQISSIHKRYLIDIMLMLQTLGIHSKVTKNHDSRTQMMPDGNGGMREYNCKELHRLLISSINTQKLLNFGLNCRRLQITVRSPQRDSMQFVEVVSVTDDGRKDNTYCFTESLEGKGMFEGALLGNCAEINQYSDADNTACCNLASINLQKFLKERDISGFNITVYGKTDCPSCKIVKSMLDDKIGAGSYEYVNLDDDDLRMAFYDSYDINTVPQIFVNNRQIGGFEKFVDFIRPDFDIELLRHVVHTAVENLDKIIDINAYPTPEAEKSNMEMRPIGLGVQGLADTCARMFIPFCSDEAKSLNKKIFEYIQLFATERSIELSKERGGIDGGGSYEYFKGSSISKGIFQHNLWDIAEGKHTEDDVFNYEDPSPEWETLRQNVKKHGIRNSLLTSLMPTASTGQILGSNASFEPFTTNMYVRRTLAGEFIVINKYLLKMLHQMGLYDTEMKYTIMHFRGNVETISRVPKFIKELFKTAWGMKVKDLIDMSADRGRFIDQSQSFNIWVEEPNEQLLTKIHFYGWKQGLKTGQYYLHSKPATTSQTFTIDPDLERKIVEENSNNGEETECLMCSS
jgi:ribonucleoside-diphosphate reductase alpha chain